MEILTVQELIDKLSKLSAKKKKALVGCRYDDNCAWTDVIGINEDLYYDDIKRMYIRLQGE